MFYIMYDLEIPLLALDNEERDTRPYKFCRRIWQRNFKIKTRALRAHTLRAPCICIIVQLGHMLSTTFTYTYEASRESCT